MRFTLVARLCRNLDLANTRHKPFFTKAGRRTKAMARSYVSSILDTISIRRNHRPKASINDESTRSLGHNLPVELWANIFYFASAIPNKSEFSTDPRGYYDLFHDPSIPSSRISSRELYTALRTRLTIVLVCQRWYTIGLRVLYSHFRVQLSIKNGANRAVYKHFTQGEKIASYVRRLTVVDDRLSEAVNHNEAMEVSKKVARAVSMLPCLVIISTERTLYWSIPTRGSPNVTIANFATSGGCVRMDIRHPVSPGPGGGWGNLKFLRLKITGSSGSAYGTASISFPQLTTLDVSIGELGWGTELNTDHSIAYYISSSWNMPKLHTFSLYSDNWTRWKGFLEAHQQDIRVLGIRNYPFNASDFPQLELPQLRELHVIPGYKAYYPGCMISSPVLELLALHRWKPGLFPFVEDEPFHPEEVEFLTIVLERWAAEFPGRARSCMYAVEGDNTLMRWLVKQDRVWQAMNVLRGKGGEVLVVGDAGEGQFREVFGSVARQAPEALDSA